MGASSARESLEHWESCTYPHKDQNTAPSEWRRLICAVAEFIEADRAIDFPQGHIVTDQSSAVAVIAECLSKVR